MTGLLSVRGLRTSVSSGGDSFDVLRGVSFDVAKGQKVGIVGESGSGKSMTALSIVKLLPRAAHITGGEVLFEGNDLARVPRDRLRSVRGAKIGMVFQDPMTSLNPVRNIGRQMTEGMQEHLGLGAKDRRARALDLLVRVKIARPEQILDSYPHQLSGGMRQRIAIAMALACRPKLIIADEPTTALDVTVQAEVIGLLEELTSDYGAAVILISHNLDLVAQYCDLIIVMYAGRIAEVGATTDVIRHPRHPYTADLIASSPDIGARRMERFAAIPGQPPGPRGLPAGCPYHPRCRLAFERCVQSEPILDDVARDAACWLEGDKTRVWGAAR